jgi:hypothetical protein
MADFALKTAISAIFHAGASPEKGIECGIAQMR